MHAHRFERSSLIYTNIHWLFNNIYGPHNRYSGAIFIPLMFRSRLICCVRLFVLFVLFVFVFNLWLWLLVDIRYTHLQPRFVRTFIDYLNKAMIPISADNLVPYC